MSFTLLGQIKKIGATKLGLTTVESYVYECLVSHGNKLLNNIFPSRNRISDLCAISVNHVTKILRSLESKGFIYTEISLCGTKNNRYTINVDKISCHQNKPNKQGLLGLGGQSQELGGAIPGITEQIIKQIINKTTTSTMNNIDPIGEPESTGDSPTVVVENNNLEPKLKTADKSNPPEFDGIKKQLDNWGVFNPGKLIEQYSIGRIQELADYIRLNSSGITKPAGFLNSALKNGFEIPSKTQIQASRDTNSIIEQQTKEKEKERLADDNSWELLRGIGQGDNFGLFSSVRVHFLSSPQEKWIEIKENLKIRLGVN